MQKVVCHYRLSMEIKRFYIFKMKFFVMTDRFKCKCLTKIKDFVFVSFTLVFLVYCACSSAVSPLDVIAAQLTTDVKTIHLSQTRHS